MSDTSRKTAILVIEDGTVAEGFSEGTPGTTFGELVFNTSMTGYQEIYTDPSYAGQVVMLTYPLIGNYGATDEDLESRRPFVRGVAMRELCNRPGSWRRRYSLTDFLNRFGIVGISGIDTRALTRRVRSFGAMRCGITTEYSTAEMIEKVKQSPEISGQDLVAEVTTQEAYKFDFTPNPEEDQRDFPEKKWDFHIALIDTGTKINIPKSLVRRGCRVTVVPAHEKAADILSRRPDGVMISNGPGDPKDSPYVVDTVRELLGRLPVMGVCLGHQMVSLALGADTYKLKFGHRGANQPVKDLERNRVVVTSQNHGYAVSADGLEKLGARVSHVNVNDGTVEGVAHESHPLISVQFHPEASPGPMDSRYLFDEFLDLIDGWKKNGRAAPAPAGTGSN